MSPAAIVIRIIILVVIFFVVIAILAFAMRMVIIFAAFGAVLVGAAVTFIVFRKLFSRKPSSEQGTTDGVVTLKSTSGSVQLFAKEPALHELVHKDNADLPATLQTVVSSGTTVEVLEESELSFKIKIKTGEQKGKVGWVDRGSVSGYTARQQ